jgi:hypothetical protein
LARRPVIPVPEIQAFTQLYIFEFMHHKVQTKARRNEDILLELFARSQQEDADLKRAVRQWNQSALYLDNLPIRLRSIPQYLTLNETHYLSTGGLSLSWKDLPKLFAQYRTGGVFEIEVSSKLADRFIPGGTTQIKHQDNLLHRPEYLKTFADIDPIQFFRRDPSKAKSHFEEESLRSHGPEFLLATATVLAVDKQDNAATIRIRVDNIKEKDEEFLTPFLRHLAYEYSLSLHEFLKQIEPVRTALNRELAATAKDFGEPVAQFLQHYSALCLACPKLFSQLPPKRYLQHLEENTDTQTKPLTTQQLLGKALTQAKEHLPASMQNIMIVPGDDPHTREQLLNKTGAQKALSEFRAILQQIAGPKAVDRLSEILLNSYLPEKPLDHKHTGQQGRHPIEFDMPVSAPRDSAQREEDLDQKMALKTQLQERSLYDRHHAAALEDPEEFNLQYRQAQEQFNELNQKVRIETSPSFVGGLRYTPDYHAPHQNGHSYPQRIALAIEAITPGPDLLPLKRHHYTGQQVIALFNVPNSPANQEMARRLALALSAGRQENQIERTVRSLLGAAHYHQQKPAWNPEQAAGAFIYACSNATLPSSILQDKNSAAEPARNYFLPQLSRTSNPIPFLLKAGAFEQAAHAIQTLQPHQKLDLLLRAQNAASRQVLTTAEAALLKEREHASQFPEHLVLTTQLALNQSPFHPTDDIVRNPLAATLGIRIRSFNYEESPLPLTLAAQLLNVAANPEQIEETLQKLGNRAAQVQGNLDAAEVLLSRNPAYQLDLDPENILKGLKAGLSGPPSVPESKPQTAQDSDDLNDLLLSLHQGRKATPWTPSAALLITAAEQSAGKENSALIRIPGEKPVELKIKLTAEHPALRLTTDKADPNGQIVLQSLAQEIDLLYTAKTQNTLSPTETVNFQHADNLLQSRRLPAVLSDLENLLIHQDGVEPLKKFVRGFRSHLNANEASQPHGSSQYTFSELNAKVHESQTQVAEAKQAISQKQPLAFELAEHLTLQGLVDQAYSNQMEKPPGIWISGTEIQTNRLWILHTLNTIAPDPQEIARQAQNVRLSLQNGDSPFSVITPGTPSRNANGHSPESHYQILFSAAYRSPQYEITPHPFEQPYQDAKTNRAAYKQALQHAVETGALELPPASSNRSQNKQRQVQKDKAQQWRVGI